MNFRFASCSSVGARRGRSNSGASGSTGGRGAGGNNIVVAAATADSECFPLVHPQQQQQQEQQQSTSPPPPLASIRKVLFDRQGTLKFLKRLGGGAFGQVFLCAWEPDEPNDKELLEQGEAKIINEEDNHSPRNFDSVIADDLHSIYEEVSATYDSLTPSGGCSSLF